MDLSNKKVFSVRISVELLERLKKLAKRQNRTLNNYVETALLHYVNKHEDDDHKVTAEEMAESLKRSIQEVKDDISGKKKLNNARDWIDKL